jgi:hypothetical protein
MVKSTQCPQQKVIPGRLSSATVGGDQAFNASGAD